MPSRSDRHKESTSCRCLPFFSSRLGPLSKLGEALYFYNTVNHFTHSNSRKPRGDVRCWDIGLQMWGCNFKQYSIPSTWLLLHHRRWAGGGGWGGDTTKTACRKFKKKKKEWLQLHDDDDRISHISPWLQISVNMLSTERVWLVIITAPKGRAQESRRECRCQSVPRPKVVLPCHSSPVSLGVTGANQQAQYANGLYLARNAPLQVTDWILSTKRIWLRRSTDNNFVVLLPCLSLWLNVTLTFNKVSCSVSCILTSTGQTSLAARSSEWKKTRKYLSFQVV